MNYADTQYISGDKISKKYGISVSCLRNWANQGKIKVIRPKEGRTKRYYSVSDINEIIGGNSGFEQQRDVICYTRVSSSHQKNDLERQVEYVLQEGSERTKVPRSELVIIREIASGVNFERHGLKTVLERVSQGKVKTVVVSYKDRLSRFGVELIQWFFNKHDTELLVLNKPLQDPDHTHELAEDLLAISNHFVAKNNAAKAVKYRRERHKFCNSLQSLPEKPTSSEVALE
jgi:predicted site-specific integrase-resolvase